MQAWTLYECPCRGQLYDAPRMAGLRTRIVKDCSVISSRSPFQILLKHSERVMIK
jgi:hypothetical protein